MSEQREGYATKSNELEKALRANQSLQAEVDADGKELAEALTTINTLRRENADLKRLLDNALVGAKDEA